MKTPMQELIEELNNVKPTQFCSIETIRDWAESLLAKEEDVIIYAFLEGCESAPDDGQPISGQTWYNETFNSKEKRSDNFEKERYPTLHWDSLPTPNEINKRNTKEK